jgi:hypothetical protein
LIWHVPSLAKHSGKARAHTIANRRLAAKTFDARLTVERLSADSLDVRELKRLGMLQDGPWGIVGQSSLALAQPPCRLPVLAGAGISRSRHHAADSRLLDALSPRRLATVDALPLFRKAILLRSLGGNCCRACIGNPLYASQAKSTHGRWHFEICKIRLQLNGMASPIDPFPDRPRGMHRKRYERMKARVLNLEMNLPPKLRGRAVDYRNLAYYVP